MTYVSMKKIQEKSKIYKYIRQNINSPSNQVIRMANTNPPPANQQSEKHRGFGEDIDQLSLCVNVSHLNVSLLYMISQEVVFPLKVSHSLVEDGIFGYRDGTSVITHQENSFKTHSNVSHGMHNP
jgi:hypothetical protein